MKLNHIIKKNKKIIIYIIQNKNNIFKWEILSNKS